MKEADMRLRHPGFFSALLLPLVGTFLFITVPPSATASDVHLVTYEGPITPVASEFLVGIIEQAAAAQAEVLIIELDTPGGLDTSMREIIKAELAAAIPIVVYVSPGGSRAASAGAFITVASHVAAMAPGTNIGSASPVQMMGGGMDSTMAHKVTNDAAAYIASIAAQKNRDPETCRAFVTEALNITASEAQALGVVEILAPSVPALLDSLQGWVVNVGESERILATAGASLVRHEMSVRQKFLKVLADPNVAYLLMLLGIYGIFFELSNPGSLFPGIAGAISILLALFAFQTLPVDYTGVGLILVGVILLILEVKVPSYGALSLGGISALVLGSLMLFDSPDQWARVSLKVLIPAVVVFAGFFVLCVMLVVRGQKRRVTTGLDALRGAGGRVTGAIGGGEGKGKVVCHGEIWDAVADGPLPVDTPIRVVDLVGRVMRVESVSAIRADDGEEPVPQPRS
jgi:membrane-bound serine protease (ClpP class)